MDPLEWLKRWTAGMAVVLIIATWPLWTLQHQFPVIPAFRFLCSAPQVVDWLCLAVLLLSLSAVTLGTARLTSGCSWLAIISGLALLALDQHRFQPWMYQLLLFLAIMLLADRQLMRRLLTWLIISVYFYSAVGKLDYEFLHTVGQQFFQALLSWFSAEAAEGKSLPIFIVGLLPLGELVLAAALAYRPSRRVAGVLACIFHLGLVLVLGPWGLHHSAGVVLWNLQFAVQAILLFSLASSAAEQHPPGSEIPPRQRKWSAAFPAPLALTLTYLAIALPIVERFGWWDHWPSWALYAPHSSRVEVLVAETVVSRLPEDLQREMPESDALAIWVRVPIERWSLASTRAPIYPQARFQLGVGAALARRLDSDFEIKLQLLSVSNRFTGSRKMLELEGTTTIERALQDLFWLNSQPRLVDR